MTISSTTRQAGPYAGNDVTTVFPFAFKVFAAADLLVVETDADDVQTELVLTTDYSVSLNGDQNVSPGGSITRVGALPAGYELLITSDMDALQPTNLTNAGGFYPKVINDALDRLTILVQQVGYLSRRALLLPFGETNLTIPSIANRASKGLGFDANGLPVAIAVPAGSAAFDLSNVSATPALANLGIPTVSALNFVTDPDVRAAIIAGTNTEDCTAYIQAAHAWLPASGGRITAQGQWSFDSAPVLAGKSVTIDGVDMSSVWRCTHTGNAVEFEPSSVGHRIEIRNFRVASTSATGSRAFVKATWPLVPSHGYTNFIMENIEIVAPGAHSVNNEAVFQYGADIKGAWQYGISNVTYFGNPATSSAWAGGWAESAFLRIDNCFGGWLNRGCIVLYAGASFLQVGYCEGIYDDGQHIGCGYAYVTDAACPNGGSGFTALGLWLNGEYNCAFGVQKLRNVKDTVCGTEADFNRWGDTGADWIGADLEDPLGYSLPPGVPVNGAPSAGHVSVGVQVRVVLGNGADVVVSDARFSNLTTAVDFGPFTTRCTVTDGTVSTGAFGPNNFINNGTGNNLAWRTSDGGGYMGNKSWRGSDGSLQVGFGNVPGATSAAIITASVGAGISLASTTGAVLLKPSNSLALVEASGASIGATDTGGGADQKTWRWVTGAGNLVLQFLTDNLASAANILTISRQAGSHLPAAVDVGVPLGLKAYTVAGLPTTGISDGSLTYATNGRKVAEAPGAGTGVVVYRSGGAWRVFSTDAAVAA